MVLAAIFFTRTKIARFWLRNAMVYLAIDPLAIAGRGGRFARFRTFTAEEHGEDRKDLQARRIICGSEQGRNIDARVARRFPGQRRADDKTVGGIVARVFVGKILVLHLDAGFEPLVLEPDRDDSGLGKAPFATAITADLLFEKPVHGPFDAFPEILRQ